MFSSVRAVLSILIAGLLLLPMTALAGDVPAGVVKDFRPVTGHVIMPVDGQFLIDLDAGNGVTVGDVFSVVKPGKEIVDPVTKKVLGSLDVVKGTLEVTRIRSGYSYATPIGSAVAITKGDEIRRFADMKAIFWDYTDAGEAFYTELRGDLPGLEWQDYATAQDFRPQTPAPLAPGKAQLYFILTRSGLTVRDAAFRLLHSYPVSVAQAATGAAAPSTPAVTVPSGSAAPAAAAEAASATAGIVTSAIVPNSAPSAIVTAKPKAEAIVTAPIAAGIWRSPPMDGIPVGIAMGDFDGDGRQEIAVAFADHLLIRRVVGNQTETLANVPLGKVKALGLDAFDLDGNGRPELYVTAVFGSNLDSLVVAEENGAYRVIQRNIPWYMRKVVLAQGPVLLGEKMGDLRTDFRGPIFRVVRQGSQVVAGPKADLPPLMNLYSFVQVPKVKEGPLYATFSGSEKLVVLNQKGKEFWRSGSTYGGTETSFERADPNSQGSESTPRDVYMKARLATAPGGVVLVPSNEGLRIFARFRTFDRSRLIAMKWDGYTLSEAWHTWPQDGYMADFCVGDVDNEGHQEVAMAIVFDSGGLFGSGIFGSARSAIYVYKLP